MHELAVTESILTIATEHAQRSGAARVTDIYIIIGQLSSIVDDSVQFYWDLISENTLCEKATLHFDRRSAKLLCQDCGCEYTLNGDLTFCPQCQSVHVKILSGDEFHLESIEITK
jgi:hydrogenase nickel incorporation protein HypA/HybF